MTPAESNKIIFTLEQLADWRRYEKVRQSGRWNMFTPQARHASGLSYDAYLFVMNNYGALRDAQ